MAYLRLSGLSGDIISSSEADRLVQEARNAVTQARAFENAAKNPPSRPITPSDQDTQREWVNKAVSQRLNAERLLRDAERRARDTRTRERFEREAREKRRKQHEDAARARDRDNARREREERTRREREEREAQNRARRDREAQEREREDREARNDTFPEAAYNWLQPSLYNSYGQPIGPLVPAPLPPPKPDTYIPYYSEDRAPANTSVSDLFNSLPSFSPSSRGYGNGFLIPPSSTYQTPYTPPTPKAPTSQSLFARIFSPSSSGYTPTPQQVVYNQPYTPRPVTRSPGWGVPTSPEQNAYVQRNTIAPKANATQPFLSKPVSLTQPKPTSGVMTKGRTAVAAGLMGYEDNVTGLVLLGLAAWLAFR